MHQLRMQDEGSQEYDVLLKVLMVGDSDVGKSSILLRFTEDKYNDEQPVTIGRLFAQIPSWYLLSARCGFQNKAC